MLATMLFRPAASRMICAFQELFNCGDTANGVSLHTSPDIWGVCIARVQADIVPFVRHRTGR
jgi:hypothetical protein